jgi:hypothetical protein
LRRALFVCLALSLMWTTMASASQIVLRSDSLALKTDIMSQAAGSLFSDSYSGPGWTTASLQKYFPSDTIVQAYAFATVEASDAAGSVGRTFSARAFVDGNQDLDLTAQGRIDLAWEFLALGDDVSVVLSMWGEDYYNAGSLLLRDTTPGHEEDLFVFGGGSSLHGRVVTLEDQHTYLLTAMMATTATLRGDPDGKFSISTNAEVVPAQVPEPGSLGLLATGVAAAAAAARKRRS